FVVLIVLSIVGIWVCFGTYITAFKWVGEIQRAIALSKTDSDAGKAAVEKVFADAKAQHVATDVQMALYRQYAEYLYDTGDHELADQQIENAIQLGKNEPPTNLGVADNLTHAYQERAWKNHYLYETGDSKISGDKDQLMSVMLAEKA